MYCIVFYSRTPLVFSTLGRQLFLFRESSNDVDMLAMGQMPWYAYGDVVNEHGQVRHCHPPRPSKQRGIFLKVAIVSVTQGASPTWQPVFVADHSHWARLLVPDGEAVFGQVADPPPTGLALPLMNTRGGGVSLCERFKNIYTEIVHVV